MGAFYNEHEPFAAAWLRVLIERGEIAPGVVDERDIRDISPVELAGYSQCHFFAGIGGWSLAARLVGIPDDYPFWSGSCPCQPFSAAGGREGFADERHLWPAFFHLVEQCEPELVVGEQVSGGNVDPWFDLVQADVEGVGYAFGLCPAPSAGFGAPHIRDRAYWVADATYDGGNGCRDAGSGWRAQYPTSSSIDGLAIANGWERDRIADGSSIGDGQARGWFEGDSGTQPGCATGELENAPGKGLGRVDSVSTDKQAVSVGFLSARSGGGFPAGPRSPRPTNGFWRHADWLGCRDGKFRPVEPGTFPLADGLPARVGRLRGYGNAINAQQAAHFLEAVISHRHDRLAA